MSRLSPVLVAALLVGAPLHAQQQAPAADASPAALRVMPSGRASTTVTLAPPRGQGQAAGAPRRISIDYGQPHARGRRIVGEVVPYDSVWRTGANEATTLRTDVDLVIGGATVPRGEYTLFTLPSRDAWKLIISRKTGQWGTDYDPTQDLARVDLRARTLREPVESLSIALVPAAAAAGAAPSGTLTIAWGDVHLSTDWRVAP